MLNFHEKILRDGYVIFRMCDNDIKPISLNLVIFRGGYKVMVGDN